MSALAAVRPDMFDDEAMPLSLSGGPTNSLRRQREGLSGTIAAIEQIFLGLGERLLTCLGVLGEMQSAFAAVTEAHASPEVASAEAAIRNLVGECLHLVDRLHQERMLIQRLTRALRTAAPRIDDLRQTVAMISAIAINARVTAAGMRNEGNSELAVFTDDVLELAQRASSVVGELQKGQSRLRTLLVNAAARSEAFEQNFRNATEHLRERIEADLAGAVGERDQAANVGSSAASISKAVAQEVSTIVASMQIGDNTRQRLEHVSAGLAVVDDEPAAAPTILRLQLAQLENTRDHLVEETGRIRDAILVLSRRIDRSFKTLKNELKQGSGSEGPGTKRLAADISRAAEELTVSETEHRHVEALAQTVSDDVEMFSACSSEMRTLEFEMRLVSLNTAVTCSKLGQEGKALGVVSLQMRDLVGEMVTRSESVAEALSELGTGAAELAELRAASEESSMAKLIADAERSLGLLQTADGKLQTVGTVLGELGDRVASLTSDAGAALGRLDGLVEELDAIEADLAGDVADETAGVPALSEEEQALFARLRASYTMEVERQIHDGLLGTPAPADAAPAGGGDADDDISAMLF
ncbi:hypothetical protein [Aurantimonas sp. VKM B-3413]|uniref:hypothetical protein n=1 Tax=Aurantimonas sp. VKM B-3413 TaxID=2779401 RepID=UPI001E54BFA5|nr:hypothetical protein [Aurantimonas sp. VKM B-3413]MCB8836449.1 hypothetical protein [Aurantimonas sp. VKM B-3413]